MPDQNKTAICLVVDRSGSMRPIKSDAEGGINEFIDKRKAEGPGKYTLRTVVFDTSIDVLNNNVDITEVPKFVLEPRGMTALLDAMGSQINAFGQELAAMDEDTRPAHVVFVLMTDGQENSSKEFSRSAVKKMVEHQQEKYGWNVVYLGANQDAIAEGASLGVSAGSSLTYTASNVGTRSVTRSMDSYVAMASAGAAPSFSDEDRKDAEQE